MDSQYFDYAAATPMDTDVAAAMQPYFSEHFFNPSATYAAARTVRADLEAARTRVAHWIGSRPAEIIFTAGGTEANNLALRGVLAHFPEGNLVTTAIEHDSVLETARELGGRIAPVSADGIVDVPELIKCVDDSTVLVSVMYANNEVGTVQPLRAISAELEKIRAARRSAGNKMPLYLHSDAAQAANYLDLHAARLGVDLLTLNAGKIYGPKQVGALYAASHVWFKAQISGGGQERGARSGTENVAGAIGFAAALDKAQGMRHEETMRLQALQKIFFELVAQDLPGSIVNGSHTHRLPNNVHITLPGQDNERLIFALDDAGFLCAAGSACSASNEEPSHVLRAMGVSQERAQSSLRFTMGRFTTEEQVRALVARLVALVR
ncbi:MAG TPA: cysteine desulfurase family protein [Candidatus Saccharimonadales bacterium]|nr:cysteine desulfurase family protein [Candidatus Saccharimonadales bacterium]